MIKERALELAAALRSGDYTQGQGTLTRRNNITGELKYCCLGVACDLFGLKPHDWEPIKDGVEDRARYPDTTPDGLNDYRVGLLPVAVQKHFGFADTTGMFTGSKTFGRTNSNNSLMTLNDTEHSFEEIADIIEQNWKYL